MTENSLMTSFVPYDFLPNSEVINGILVNSSNLNFVDLSAKEKGSIDVQIADANVNRFSSYDLSIKFNATDKNNINYCSNLSIHKSEPNFNNLCEIDYCFEFETI